ncbi:MAG: potassium transporter TrkG [Pseudomonadota bacterium]
MQQKTALSAPAVIALVYVTCIALGALGLKTLTVEGITISWSDAFFTATSAVTVTGLTVFDIGSTLRFEGELLLVLLMQLGGLGLMTLGVVVLSTIGIKVDLVQRVYLRTELGTSGLSGILRLARKILTIVIVFELLGALALGFIFVPQLGVSDGVWAAVFHSVSAFNNAGFSLFADSMVSQALASTSVLLVLSSLFVVGGLGFIVLSDVIARRHWSAYSFHTKLTLAGAATLLVLGPLFVGLLEWNNSETLGGIANPASRLVFAWFEGVTPRTAGFNAIPTAQMTDANALVTLGLMVVGGGSTSTAGGLKVTTAVVLVLSTVAFFRRSEHVHCFDHSISTLAMLKVMALVTISFGFLFVATFLLLVTHDLALLDAAFEVTSAFATVGLSRGATGELNEFGRIVIGVVMFFGRLGPLTLGLLLTHKASDRLTYPEGEVLLG